MEVLAMIFFKKIVKRKYITFEYNYSWMLLSLFIAISLIIPTASAADPGHSAAVIGAGTFESGNYVFPNNFTVGSSNAFFVNNNTQRIGIGTTAPTRLLDVRGIINASGEIYVQNFSAVSPWLYNQTGFSTTFNSSYAAFAYNHTIAANTSIVTTYSGQWYNHTAAANTSIFNTYDARWSLTYNASYAGFAYNNSNWNISNAILFLRDLSYNVSIGMTTASEKLSVLGDVKIYNGSFIAQPDAPVVVGTKADALLDSIDYVAVQGRYAYVTGENTGTFTVIDISVPTAPVIVGYIGNVTNTANNLTDFNGPRGVIVDGRYAYVASGASDSITVIDISDPMNMSQLGVVSSSTQLDDCRYPALSGRYLFCAAINDDRITAVDVSNPRKPAIVSSSAVDTTDTNNPWRLEIQGKYAYVTVRFDSLGNTNGSRLTIFDISDPTSIIKVGSVTSGNLNDSRAMYVSGAYAYVGGYLSRSLVIFNISNVSAPSEVGHLNDSTNFNSIYDIKRAGNYLYVASESDRFSVVDVSNPAAPFVHHAISSATQLDGVRAIALSGRYAYTAATVDDMLTVIDIGSEFPTLSIGALSAGILSVEDNAVISGHTRIGGSLSVGENIFSRGLAVYSDSYATSA